MLDTFTIDTFSGRVGETFRVIVNEQWELRAELASARVWGTEADTHGVRVPFTLTFRGPGPGVLPQSIYEVQHAELGSFMLFLVPVGQQGDGVEYEAVFT